MSKTRGTPFDDGPDPGLSIRDPFGEFLSESALELRPARTSDELELLAPEDVAAEAFAAGRPRSFSWPLLAGLAVIGITAGSVIGVMTRGRALPSSGERLVQPAVSRAVSSRPSAPVVTHGAAPAVPVIEQVPSPTSSRLRSGKRSNIDSRAVALPPMTAAAGPTATAAHRPSSDDVEAIPVVTPARASLLPEPVPASPTANPAIPTSLAPSEARVIASASDPDRDELMYRWSAPIGRFANAMARETVYTCPDTPTTVELTVTVTDGHGGVASDTLTIHCVEHR